MSLRKSIKEPIPAILQAWDLLTRAADAHLEGDHRMAEIMFRAADLPKVWHWVNPASGPSPTELRRNVQVFAPIGDTKLVALSQRDPTRNPTRKVKAAVIARDGYRCRYCGIPVIDARIRKIAHALYPDAIPWIDGNERAQHAAFQCFWLQYDHVVPHSHGGGSSEDNVVVSCYLCNFGKDQYTLKQLAISDPRITPPVAAPWDGLERLRIPTAEAPSVYETPSLRSEVFPTKAAETSPAPAGLSTFFLPGARISKGYLYTPPIDGKERWFKLGARVLAKPTERNGVLGCLLACDAVELRRRGISLKEFILPNQPPFQ